MAKTDVVLQGFMTVFGPFGVGKSTLGWLASKDPKKIVYIDGGTSKERDMADSLQLNIVTKPSQQVTPGSYVDLAVMTLDMNDLETFKVQYDLIRNLPSGLSAIIVDDVFFSGAHAYVHEHPTEFKAGGIHGADINMKIGMEWGAARKMLLPDIYTTLRNKATLVLFLNREKPARDENGNEIPGAVEPDADKSLYAASMFSIKLAHNTRELTDIPVGLVTKNQRVVDPPKQTVTTIFPKRIPTCDWKTIEHYTKPGNYAGSREELPEEVPDEKELHAIRGTLTPEQEEQYRLSQQLALAGVKESLSAAVKEKASELKIPNRTALVQAIVKQLDNPLVDKEFVEANLE